MVAFIPALQLTSVSNVAIIIATGPFVAAGLAWIWLREAARATTLIASLVALCGVAIIVGNARGVSDTGGIGLDTGEGDLLADVRLQAEEAMAEADIIVWVVDASTGLSRTANQIAALQALVPGFTPFDLTNTANIFFVKSSVALAPTHRLSTSYQRDPNGSDSGSGDVAAVSRGIQGGNNAAVRVQSIWNASWLTEAAVSYNDRGFVTQARNTDQPARVVYQSTALSGGRLVGVGRVAGYGASGPSTTVGGGEKLLPRGRGLEEEDRNSESNAQVKREHQAVLAAPQQGSNAELHDGSFEGTPESWQPTAPTRAGQDVRLLHDFAQRAEVGQRISNGRSAPGNRQSCPRSTRQWDERRVHGSIQLLKQPQEPIGRKPLQPSLILRRAQSCRCSERRFEKVHADQQTESGDLQKRRNAEESAARKQLRREPLNAQHGTENKAAGGDRCNPIGGECPIEIGG